MSAALIAARGLEVRHGDLRAVCGVDVDIAPGEIVGLIGPDGAGKTSTLRVLAGLHRPDGGDVRAFGEPVWANRRALHRRLGYLAQGFSLYGDLTVDENVQFFAQMFGVERWRERRDDLLERVELERFRARQAGKLSGGMKQKLALACTLIHSPDVLVLDEPTTGVDPVTRRELWRILGGLVREGLALLLATPYLDEAERCSRVVLLHRGEVLADRPPGEVPELVPGVIVDVAARPLRRAADALREEASVADLAVFGDRLHARLENVDEPEEAVRRALEGAEVEVESVRTVAASLEDAFLYLTTHRGDAREEAA